MGLGGGGTAPTASSYDLEACSQGGSQLRPGLKGGRCDRPAAGLTEISCKELQAQLLLSQPCVYSPGARSQPAGVGPLTLSPLLSASEPGSTPVT